MTIALDVALVAYRSRATIAASIEAARRIPGVGAIVVVDHGDDGSADVAAALGATVTVDPANPGFGAGHNRAVAGTSAPYVLLLNPDAVVEPAAIVAGVRYLDDHPDVAAVQGAVLAAADDTPERSQGREVGPVHLVGRAVGARRLLRFGWAKRIGRASGVLSDHVDRVPTEAVAVESLAATVLLVRRRAFDEVGGFDDSYFLYGEDLDLARRLRGAGWVLVALPQVWATHEGGASSGSWWAREISWWQGTMQFAARWWSTAPWLVALIAAAVRCVGLIAARPARWREPVRAFLAEPVRVRRCRASAGAPPAPTRRYRGRR